MEKAKSKKKTPGEPARTTIGDRAPATGELREAQAGTRTSVRPVFPAESLEGLGADRAEAGHDRTAVSMPYRGSPGIRGPETPDGYVAAEYPWLEKSQDVPRLLKALLREVVAGRLNG